MTGRATEADVNRLSLAAELARVRRTLEQRLGLEETSVPPGEAATASMETARLDTLCAVFGLSAFERDVLALCLAAQLEPQIGALCGHVQGDPARAFPTFGLALTVFADAHWSALIPAAPLRYWRLVELESGAGEALLTSRLWLDERVLHHLAGLNYVDDRIGALIKPAPQRAPLSPWHAEQAHRVAALLVEAGAPAAVQLYGDDTLGQRAVAVAAGDLVGARVYRLRGEDIPASAVEREALARLWEREAALVGGLLVVEAEEATAAVAALLDELHGAVVVIVHDRLPGRDRPLAHVEVSRPCWQSLDERHTAQADVQGAERLGDLAQRIEPMARWDDLVLPPGQLSVLREIAAHVRHSHRVYIEWGFAAKSSRGLGISALFAGASGTGKTMAAEVLANELQLELYRIDLSAVVSKYIGETEKNLRRVFDVAEASEVILLFDEADALFGKRSEVKDSHDRYANIEVSYLLQRMEAYGGLAILTTNLKSALDPAFLRRIRFIVNFAFPDAAQRALIWQRMFPAATPTRDLDISKLARLNIPGGNIRNIALHAAFLAADADEPVSMAHLAKAARNDYSKSDKPLTDAEIGNW